LYRPWTSACDDAVAESSDALDLELHDVARLQVAVELETATSTDRAGADHLAGVERLVAGEVHDHVLPAVVHVGGAPARPLLAVDARGHRRRVRVGDLVGRDEIRPER